MVQNREITYLSLYKTLLNGESWVMPDIVKLITPTWLTKYCLQLGICIPKLLGNLIPLSVHFFIEERKQSKFSLIAYDFSAKQVYSCGIK